MQQVMEQDKQQAAAENDLPPGSGENPEKRQENPEKSIHLGHGTSHGTREAAARDRG